MLSVSRLDIFNFDRKSPEKTETIREKKNLEKVKKMFLFFFLFFTVATLTL